MKTLIITPILLALCSFASIPSQDRDPQSACVPGCTSNLTVTAGAFVTIELEFDINGKKVMNTVCEPCADEPCEGEVRFRYDGPNDWEANTPTSQGAHGTGRYRTTWLLKTACSGAPEEYTFESDGGGVTSATLDCGC